MGNPIIDQLMPLTDSERQYLEGKKSHYLSKLTYIVINKKEVAYMMYPDFSQMAHPFIQIRKRPRFQDWPMHCHNWVEINYLLQGHYTQVVNDVEYSMHEGSLILLDAMTPHTIKKLREEDLLIDICISKEYLSSSFFNRLSSNSQLLDFFTNFLSKKINSNHFIIFEHVSKKLNDLMMVFLTEWLNPGFSYTDMIDSLFAAVIAELVNLMHLSTTSDGQEMNPKVFDALKYIEKNYHTCSLHDLSEELGLNPNYISNMLKKQIGSTYRQLLQIQRIGMAKKLFNHTDLSVADVGAEVGYQNMYFFYRKFKEEVGMTPGEFRKHSRSKDKTAKRT